MHPRYFVNGPTAHRWLPKVVEHMTKRMLELFKNKPYDYSLESLNELTEHEIDNILDIGRIGGSYVCPPTSTASATLKSASKALEISRVEAFKKAVVPEGAGKLS